MSDRTRTAVALGLVLAVVAVAFSPVLDNGFVNWDDPSYLFENRLIRSLGLVEVGALFSTTFNGNYHPLTLLTYAIEHHFFGFTPHPYHLVNYLLHLINAVLVFFLSRTILRSSSAAIFCSLAFGLHPLRVESVAWVSALKDVLSGSFILGSLLCYARGRAGGNEKALLAAAFILFCLAALSKPMAVSLPLLLLLIDRYLGIPLSRRSIARLSPFFLVSILVALMAFVAQRQAEAITTDISSYGPFYGLILFHNIWFYLSRFFLPFGLSAFYPYPSHAQVIAPQYLFGAAAGALFLLSLLPFPGKARDFRLGGWFFLVMLLPVLRIVPVGNTPVADRYFYLPGLGLLWALCGVGSRLLSGRDRPVALKVGAALVAACWLGLLGGQSWQRTPVWRDSVSLWSDVVRQYPRDFLAHFNLGRGYMEKRDAKSAEDHFTTALMLKPRVVLEGKSVNDPYIHYARGQAYLELGRHREAEMDFSAAVNAKHDFAGALIEMGLIHAARGEYREAEGHLARALAAQPEHPLALVNLGEVALRTGDAGKALAYFNKVKRLGYTGDIEQRIARATTALGAPR